VCCIAYLDLFYGGFASSGLSTCWTIKTLIFLGLVDGRWVILNTIIVIAINHITPTYPAIVKVSLSEVMPNRPFSQLTVETAQKISQYMDCWRSKKLLTLSANHLQKIATTNIRDAKRVIIPKFLKIQIGKRGMGGANQIINKISSTIIIFAMKFMSHLGCPFKNFADLYARHTLIAA
jgi:hypothetical protein